MAMRRFRRRRYTRRRGRFGRRRARMAPIVINNRPARRRRRMTAKKALTRFELAQMNPFHPEAIGAKIPDANAMPSCPIQVCDEATVTTEGTYGSGIIAWRPFVSASYVFPNGFSAGDTWTWNATYGGGNDSGRKTSIANNFSLVRPVAHGVRISSPLSPTSVTGYVHIAIFAGNMYNATTWDFPTTISMMSNGVMYKRLPLALLCGKQCTIVNRSIDFSNERYADPASDLAANASDITFQTTGWGTILVAVTGGPTSKAVLVCENLVHLEGIPLKTGVADSTPAASFNPTTLSHVTQAVNAADPVVVTDGNEADVLRERARGSFLQGARDTVVNYANAVVPGYAYNAGAGLAAAGITYAGRRVMGNGQVLNGVGLLH